jgi:hypothetical protein
MKFGSALLLLATTRSILCAEGNDSVAKTLEDTIFKAIETGLNGVDIVPIDGIDPNFRACSITSSVTCAITSTLDDCEDFVIPLEQCRDIDMTFTYRYCNKEKDDDVTFISEKTTALFETLPIEGLNYNDLSPGKCHEFSITQKIDTCKRFFSASLKVEGTKGPDFENGDYCYAWDFLRIFIKRPCEITAEISSCKIESTKENCDDFIVAIDECQEVEPTTFTFKYCNNEETAFRFRTQKFRPLVETLLITGFDLTDLQPGTCREFETTRDINTCKKFFSSSLKVEGFRGDGVGDYCYAYDFERIFTGRPDDPPPSNGKACDVSSSVKCFITGSDQPCDDIVVPDDECDEETDMTFEFEYCNFEEANPINLIGRKKTIAKVETEAIDLNLSMLSPGECRTLRTNRKINTCKKFFSASLKVEGRRGDNYEDYCFAYDFYRSYIERPQTNDNNTGGVTVAGECNVSADITCTIEATGEECDDIVVPRDECMTDMEMTFIFEYCSRELVNTIDLYPELTRARVETIGLSGLNFADLQPGECRRLISKQKINTCNRFFSSQLKVEGVRNGIGGYCYGWDFYRSYINRLEQNAPSATSPNPSPTDDEGPCAVTAQVTCTNVATGQDCKDIIVPLNECNEATPMTFEFEYCNFEVSEEIVLRKDKTIALIDTVSVDTLNLSDIPAGACRRRIETRNINTCNKFFSAQLKVEGFRGGVRNDYCYAFDFYRNYIQRTDLDNKEPTPANEPTPQGPSGACNIRAEITCIVDDTGEPCDVIEVDTDTCDEETDMTFTFKYCNEETESFVDLIEDVTTAQIEATSVDGLVTSDLDAGTCRTLIETRQINTCKRFFSASLKVEGLRDGVPNDYCYAFDFYRTYITRPDDNSPVASPGIDCEISAAISCTYDKTQESCDNLVIPIEDCEILDGVTFQFTYCSDDKDFPVVLREDKTVALIETIPVANLDKRPLLPGQCRILEVNRNVDTCKRFFSAGLKVEGLRTGVDGYCFAYDHYRTFIKRAPSAPTLKPSASPSLIPTVSVMPSNAPTACGIGRDERRSRITEIIELISSSEDLQDPDSPQSKAKEWMLEIDEFDVFCADACSKFQFGAGVFQRYSVAVFYFATNGDSWITCGGESDDCIPTLTNIDRDDNVPVFFDNEFWLSNSSECLWGGLSCKVATKCLDRIEFGESMQSMYLPQPFFHFYKRNIPPHKPNFHLIFRRGEQCEWIYPRRNRTTGWLAVPLPRRCTE